MVPLFKPVGLGDWRSVTSLISGFIAKESVVSTLIVLFGSGEGVASIFTSLQAISLLVFCLLYTPCVASIAAVKRELGLKRALFMVVFQCSVAWIVAFVIYNIGLLIF